MHFTRRKWLVVGGISFFGILVLAIILGIYFGIISKVEEGTTYVAGVVTNGYECSEIGGNILQQGGTAVDAAIAALLCEGVAMPQSMGVGGGFLMTIYIRESKTAIALNAREAAPLQASKDMYSGNSSLAEVGGLAVAVPGELRGYWYAHQRYGKLPWASLIQPTIDLCKRGHYVTAYLSTLFANQKRNILASETLREMFINPDTNDTYKEGDYVQRLRLAETLEVIASEGADALYNGSLTKTFIQDIQDLGGIITEEDLAQYIPLWESPASIQITNYTLHSSPLPGSGGILAFLLNVLEDHLDRTSWNKSVTNWQRIVETFKYGYARRTELGDPLFVDGMDQLMANLTSKSYAASIRSLLTDDVTFQDPVHYGVNASYVEDHGTAHISVIAGNGDAVSVTSTINLYFGAKIASRRTGIILNNEMDDFSSPGITNSYELPPMPNNYIEPRKRPISSMCPTILVDQKGDVRMIVGAAGGTKITTAVALVILRYIWFSEQLQQAVNATRLHHQLFPMTITFEQTFDRDLVAALAEIGHNYTRAQSTGFSALTAIAVENGNIVGASDPRRPGRITLLPSSSLS